MKPTLKHITLAIFLAATANVGAQEGHGFPYRYFPSYTANYNGADGGPISVVIDGKAYKGIASRLDTGRAYVYQSLLQSADGKGLRCQLVDEGRRRQISGHCIDDNQRSFEVHGPRRDVRH